MLWPVGIALNTQLSCFREQDTMMRGGEVALKALVTKQDMIGLNCSFSKCPGLHWRVEWGLAVYCNVTLTSLLRTSTVTFSQVDRVLVWSHLRHVRLAVKLLKKR